MRYMPVSKIPLNLDVSIVLFIILPKEQYEVMKQPLLVQSFSDDNIQCAFEPCFVQTLKI